MTTLLIAISAALAVCVVVLLVLLVVLNRRSSRAAQDSVADVVRALENRMDELSHELAGAVARAEEEGRRSRFLGEIAGSIDLDEVLSRTLEAAGSLPGADAALVTLRSHDGKPIVATLGLSAEEAERQAIAGPPDGRQARSIAISYRYGTAEVDANGELIHGGLAVPMPGDSEEELGYLTVFTRSHGRSFGEDDTSYFHETLAREVARAQRYNRRLGLIVFDLDDFKDVNDRIGHLAGDAVLAELAERVRDVVRSADIACRVGGDEFAVILPESSLEDGDQLYRRIQNAVASRPVESSGNKIYLSAGVAELRPDDDAVSFFQRADEALYRAKEAGKARAVGANSG